MDLLLCGHHYQASGAALQVAGTTAYDSSGTLIMPAGAASLREPAPAGMHQVTR